jgi:hypothetical protein
MPFSNYIGYIALDHRIIVNNKLERMWKEKFVIYFKILTQNLPAGTKENHKKI